MNKKNFPIFSASITTELFNRGFKCIDSQINTRYPQYKVFYFEDTEELRAAFDDILRSRENKTYQNQKEESSSK